MKIRSKNGEIIDLAELSKYVEFVRASESLEMRKQCRIDAFSSTLDALEAALSVQTSTPASDTWQRGWNACKNAVRDAAGEIEENPA